MIQFEIKYPHLSKPASSTFYFDKIYIGNSTDHHIIIPSRYDKSLLAEVLHSEDGTSIKGLSSLVYYVNGKKLMGTKLLKVNDIINIKNILIKIIYLDTSNILRPMELEQNYENFIEVFDEYTTIISAMEKELLF